MMPLGGDSKTQDGINSHLAIIDEYHAHATDGVKENLESSSVQRSQPITWHITTAGTNASSVCKNYEDSVIDILEGRNIDNHLWIMIHDLDPEDDWEDETVWFKANPLLGQGLDIENLRIEFIKAKNQPSKIPNFKTKHLNIWVDGESVWIPSEIWKQNKVDTIPLSKFKEYGSYAGLDLSTTTDITAFVILSEPDKEGNRYLKEFLFCPENAIEKRSKEDKVPYRYWRDKGWLIATPGNVVDYDVVEDYIKHNYEKYNIQRIERDRWNSNSIVNHLVEEGFEVSDFSQTITTFSHPTKMFEKLVYEGKILHEANPIMDWMLSGCVTISDHNENIRISKGKSQSNGKRIDGIIAAIMALGGSLSPKEDQGKYSKPTDEIYI
jgi:phage terminase large subunit-like protein